MPRPQKASPERRGYAQHADIEAIAAALEVVEEARRNRPSLWYAPHPQGQVQMHQSKHVVRAMFPGNGWGKTRAMGTELAWWVDHAHPHQPTPEWPIIAIWFCQEFKQFDILKTQLETECFTAGWTWCGSGTSKFYVWPNGDKVFIASADRSWTYLQGINPDLICFDEQPPLSLWREMLQRRRGTRKTRYLLAATATQGETWMEKEIHAPWVMANTADGENLEQARQRQRHEYFWVWDEGGIRDNPGADDEDVRWYETRTWSCEAERRVRLRGGFQSFNGSPVFDPDALAELEARALAADKARGKGRIGSLDFWAPITADGSIIRPRPAAPAPAGATR
ncbi:MAG: hypothetical protein IT469_01765 [Pseudomonadales bacterium]|nr:hypothetical protein [Pseudomonadales bacterium]